VAHDVAKGVLGVVIAPGTGKDDNSESHVHGHDTTRAEEALGFEPGERSMTAIVP
jgi:hypothetical protein